MLGGHPDGFLLGTAEREQVLQALGAHLEAGRLSLDQYDQRVSAAIAAQTRGELRPLFRDLPPPYPPFMAWHAQAPVVVSPPVVFDELSTKSAHAAGWLQLLLPVGAGRFYLGNHGMGACQAFCALMSLAFFDAGLWVGSALMLLWSWIDGIVLLTAGGTDTYGRRLRR